MAERLNKRQAESARQLISTQRVIQELHKCVDGEREMSSQQVQAARILLDKSLPNLQATELEHSGEGLTVSIGTFVKPVDD